MLKARYASGGFESCRTLEEALCIEPDTHVVSFIGAGGKSSLMLALAKEAASTQAVVMTTTTRIVPLLNYFPDKDDALERMHEPGVVTLADPAGGGKLQYPGDAWFTRAAASADLILIEADGSKQLPLKFPAGHEPVIHPATERVVLVTGLSAIGKPFINVCQRHQLASDMLGIPEAAAVSVDTIERLILEGYHLTDFGMPVHIALNQVDSDLLLKQASVLAERLMQRTRGAVSVSAHSLDAVDRIAPFVP